MPYERIFGVLDVRPKIIDSTNATEITEVTGEILIKDLCFSYDHTSPILSNLSMTVPAGKTVALVRTFRLRKEHIFKFSHQVF